MKTTSRRIITIANINTKNLVEEKSNAVTNILIKKTIIQTLPNTGVITGSVLKN